jgi:predicted kinase
MCLKTTGVVSTVTNSETATLGGTATALPGRPRFTGGHRHPPRTAATPWAASPCAGVLNARRPTITLMHGNRQTIAHIVVGFIGAGKTTFARRLEQETGAVRFTKDEWMVRLFGNTPPKDKFAEYDHRMATLATDMALKCLQAGVDVIIDEGFWVKEHRDAIRERVTEAGAVAKVYYIEAPLEVMKARTLARSDNPPADSYVIDEVDFDHYWGFFRPPGEEEEFELIHSS